MTSFVYWVAVLLIVATSWGVIKHINFCLKQSQGRSGWKSWLHPPMTTTDRELMDRTLGCGGWKWYNVRLLVIGLVVRLAWITVLILFARWLRPDAFLSNILF